ncbi:DNA-binding transcriptional regulator, LysR family [Rhizobium sp. NFR07]|uniref:LysR family transcriptional regulator n=1 Tax=Rhizobium sp. NFR07 TaxID=1566262 RepID=UPI0008E694AB|nr:LysR family transcriptional regulator [Rhizobium sp. NFR07]SFB17391.1 DNA-binding transcriptional regulator, LysR family [Rhizobium sp. NFR07]
MENLGHLESFVRSAELGGFSAAARRLGLTPAAVSRNVAMLERSLGIRLFQRTTRKLALTEAGERFLAQVGGHVEALQVAIADASSGNSEPVGILKVSMSPHFGRDYILPLLPAFMEKYPRIRPEWTFENRQVDLVTEGYDAAIGGGLDLTPGLISRTLAPAHLVAVASPAYMRDRAMPVDPQGLSAFVGIQMRSSNTGRIRQWSMRNIAGEEMPAALTGTFIMNDPAAIASAASLGLGVALIATPDALIYFERRELIRLLPDWYADIGTISLYYANRTLLPAKTRVFIDFVTEYFRKEKLAERLAGSLGTSNLPRTT